MSVLIKGMEMPKYCRQCFFFASGCPCKKYKKGRPSNCPLIEDSSVVSREDYEGLELVCKNYEEALKDAVDELEENDRNEFENPSCSVCHCGLVLFIIDENNALIKPNFCPNCGAKMEREEEE